MRCSCSACRLFLRCGSPRTPGRAPMRARVLVTLALAAAAALLALLLVDGAITNPSGFCKRIAFLTGPASADYAEYVRGPAGWWALLGDMFALLRPRLRPGRRGAGGAGRGAWRCARRGAALAVALLPLLAVISFTLCFNFAALRSDARFLLPQAVLACVYIGIAAEVLVFAARPGCAGSGARGGGGGAAGAAPGDGGRCRHAAGPAL